MGFVGDMKPTLYHYPKSWAKTSQWRVYVNNKYVTGCYGKTIEQAYAKYVAKTGCKIKLEELHPQKDENLMPLALMLTASAFLAAYLIIEGLVL